jgi:hypothetical protein
MMMGFHTAISRQNETFHHRNHMNIIILNHNGKDGTKQHFLESIEEAYYLVEVMLFSSVFPGRVVPDATVT